MTTQKATRAIGIMAVLFFGGRAFAIELCDAEAKGDRISITRHIIRAQTKTTTKTVMVEVDGNQVPEVIEQTETVEIPVIMRRIEPVGNYRVTDIGDQEVSEEKVIRMLATRQQIVYLRTELPAIRRGVFKPTALFFEWKGTILKKKYAKQLEKLAYRQREIIKLRYGLSDGYVYTDEEIAHIFKITPTEVDAVIHEIRETADLPLPEPPEPALEDDTYLGDSE